jgi:hypothetical protein
MPSWDQTKNIVQATHGQLAEAGRLAVLNSNSQKTGGMTRCLHPSSALGVRFRNASSTVGAKSTTGP